MEQAVLSTIIILSVLVLPGHTQEIPKPVLTLHHNFSDIYLGESVTLRCDIQVGRVTDWEYRWFEDGDLQNPIFSSNENEYKDSLYSKKAYAEFLLDGKKTGNFSCMGVRKSDMQQSHVSDAVELTVHIKPRPDVKVSPSWWLRVGDSATLRCELSDSSEGWTYYWYRAFPYQEGLPSDWTKTFSVEMLPDLQSGTNGSLSLNPVSLKHIESYVCRAGRGNPEYYTKYSFPELLWVSAASPSATLRLSPNRLQHFSGEAFTVSCEGHGNSTGWKVKKFTWSDGSSECGIHWGTMTGSSCHINASGFYDRASYWCQSDSGEYSDAANITVQISGPVALDSPVLPVPEGQSVKLSCRYKTPPADLRAEFYKYDSLIGSARNGEMTIYSVSKSDEGKYWCKNPELGESWHNWLSVRASSVSLHLSRPPTSWLLCALLILHHFSQP